MADGHFIRLGDETTCGGKVLEADTRVTMFGIAHARVGDRVSCGKSDETYEIVGGVPYIDSHGRLVAGSLDSYSNCPCKAGLTPSFFTACYESTRTAAPYSRGATSQPTASFANHSAAARSATPKVAPNRPTPTRMSGAAPQEPGFYIVPKSTTREQLEASLFTLRDPAVMGKFKLLNPNLSDIKAGSMIVLSDPDNFHCSREEVQLMDVAAKVNQVLAALSPDEADFMVPHRDVIQTFLTYGSGELGFLSTSI